MTQTAEIAPPVGDAVHVWRVRFSEEEERLRRWRSALQPEEVARADRYRFERDRVAFTVTRAVLRTLLFRYLGVDPRFHVSRYGKPRLADDQPGPRISFNVSHSGDYALLAFGVGEGLGVDIECLAIGRDTLAIADRILTDEERSLLADLPAAQQPRALMTAWTRKEAVAKAIGLGLSLPFEEFAVTFRPGEPARVAAAPPDLLDPKRWTLLDVDVAEDYVAALAVEAPSASLGLWTL